MSWGRPAGGVERPGPVHGDHRGRLGRRPPTPDALNVEPLAPAPQEPPFTPDTLRFFSIRTEDRGQTAFGPRRTLA